MLLVVGFDVWLGPAEEIAVALAGLSPWLFFAAWVVAVAAAARRRWWLFGAALVLVVVHATVLLPDLRPWGSAPAAKPGTTWTVYDQNVKFDNTDLTEVGRQIAAQKPDVVALEELSTQNLPSLEATHALDAYPYHLVYAQDDGPRGFGLWSKLPLFGAQLQEVAFVPVLHATIESPGGPTFLVVVHTVSPPVDATVWSRELNTLARTAATGRDQPVLIVGDFNATPAMKQVRQYLDHGYTDAAIANGEGWHMTWGQLGPVRVMQLDHALFSGPLTVTHYRTGHASGSDHLPLLFTVGRRA